MSFANRVPDEKFSIEPVPLLRTEQALRTPGKILYAVKENGSLVIARKDSNNLFGHFDLARGENILAGGKGRIYSGQVKFLDNASGHYLPEGQSAQDAAVNAFGNALGSSLASGSLSGSNSNSAGGHGAYSGGNNSSTSDGNLDFWAANQAAKEQLYLVDNGSQSAVASFMTNRLGLDHNSPDSIMNRHD